MVVLAESGFFGKLLEGAVAVVAIEEVRRAVPGVVVRDRMSRKARLIVLQLVRCHIKVEPAVRVKVGGASGHRVVESLSGAHQANLDRVAQPEFAASCVCEKEGAVLAHQEQVGVPVVVVIQEQDSRGVVQDIDSGCCGGFRESAVGVVEEKAVGQGGRLGDVKVLPSVAIHVGHRHSGIALVADGKG